MRQCPVTALPKNRPQMRSSQETRFLLPVAAVSVERREIEERQKKRERKKKKKKGASRDAQAKVVAEAELSAKTSAFEREPWFIKAERSFCQHTHPLL